MNSIEHYMQMRGCFGKTLFGETTKIWYYSCILMYTDTYVVVKVKRNYEKWKVNVSIKEFQMYAIPDYEKLDDSNGKSCLVWLVAV